MDPSISGRNVSGWGNILTGIGLFHHHVFLHLTQITLWALLSIWDICTWNPRAEIHCACSGLYTDHKYFLNRRKICAKNNSFLFFLCLQFFWSDLASTLLVVVHQNIYNVPNLHPWHVAKHNAYFPYLWCTTSHNMKHAVLETFCPDSPDDKRRGSDINKTSFSQS